jgi:hypothetical protein
VWERVWPALWPASGIVGAYVAAALFWALFAVIPVTLHSLLLFTVVARTVTRSIVGLSDVSSCREWEEAARRVERDSTLPHRPAHGRRRPAACRRGRTWAEALWRAHLKRLLAGIARLRIAMPSPGLPH